MSPKTVTFRKQWMVEVVGRIVHQADFLHHATRARVLWHGERYDSRQPNNVEPVRQRGPGALRRIPATPVFRSETPPDFDTWCEVRVEARHRETDETGERRHVIDLDGPQTKAIPVEIGVECASQDHRFRRATTGPVEIR